MAPSPVFVRSAAGALLCTALLGGCGKAPAPPAGKAAGAQVLPGTISDSMLDLDKSQSQPLLQPAPRSHAAGPDTASDAADDTAAAPADAPAVKPEAVKPPA